MGGLAAKLVFKSGKEKMTSKFTSLHDIPAEDIDGNHIERLGNLIDGKKAIIVVNVASK
jgi:hypothetical protein